MIMRHDTVDGRDASGVSVEEIRVLATILLVLYHVIGTPASGMKVDDASILRILADLFADFRMPAFAFIAGFIYALRPLANGRVGSFFLGKLQRLALPGLIAMLAFAIVASAMRLPATLPLEKFWHPLVYPYVHYWFLQSILALFFVIGPLDAMTRGKAGLPMLAVATLLYLLPVHWPQFFALAGTVRLAPFFVAGICYVRHRDWIERHAAAITLVAIALIVTWCVWTAIDYARLGAIDTGNRAVQAMIFALPACALMLFYLPQIPSAKLLGRFSFTIYLYHVFGTSGMRVALYKAGIVAVPVHLLSGLAAGLVLPILLHMLAMRSPLTAQFLLGIKTRKDRAAAPRGAVSALH